MAKNKFILKLLFDCIFCYILLGCYRIFDRVSIRLHLGQKSLFFQHRS